MNNLRGINKTLISEFKKSSLHALIMERAEDLLACIRNNAIGIYYNSDRVAKVSLNRSKILECEISSYYLSDYYLTDVHPQSEILSVSPDTIVGNIDIIMKNSARKSTAEKKAQQRLVFQNNSNPTSGWYCFDIEYRQSTKVQSDEPKFDGRFDILAISKKKPYRIAVIELKYGSEAIGGSSGVVKHIKDFCNFAQSNSCFENLKKEIPIMLENLTEIGYEVPVELLASSTSLDDAELEFHFICLYEGDSTKGTVGGYLFDKIKPHWDTKRKSTVNAMTQWGIDVESPECPINVKFLFKKVSSPIEIPISDILDSGQYDSK